MIKSLLKFIFITTIIFLPSTVHSAGNPNQGGPDVWKQTVDVLCSDSSYVNYVLNELQQLPTVVGTKGETVAMGMYVNNQSGEWSLVMHVKTQDRYVSCVFTDGENFENID